jgi:hypothetical protein
LQWIENISNSLVSELENTNYPQSGREKIPALAQNSLTKTKSTKNIFNILVILISLMIIPFFFQFLAKESQNNQSIEQGNNFFRKINSIN